MSMEGRMREAFSLESFSFVSKPFEQQHINEVLEEFSNRRIGRNAFEEKYREYDLRYR